MQKVRESLKKRYPKLWRLLGRMRHPTSPLPFGLWLMNFVVQRILRINGAAPWMVHFTSIVEVPDRITVGERVWLSFARSGGCYIQGGNGIQFGDRVIFAPGVKIISANHDPIDLAKWAPSDPITIGDDCWIGANAVILPGCTLGERCVVGAGAVVTTSFPPNRIVAGVPAREIGSRPPLLESVAGGKR